MNTPTLEHTEVKLPAERSLELWKALEVELPTKAVNHKSLPRAFFNLNTLDLIHTIKRGVPADLVRSLSKELHIPIRETVEMLGFPASTISRKAKDSGRLPVEQGERLLQVVRLIGLVEEIIQEYGDPELSKGFDAGQWLGQWLETPHAALGGKRPAEYLDTAKGGEMVENLLKNIAEGGFA